MLPTARLRRMGAKRLWYEMEDFPVYSRFLQAMLQLLTEVESAEGLLCRCAPEEVPAAAAAAEAAALQALEAIETEGSAAEAGEMRPAGEIPAPLALPRGLSAGPQSWPPSPANGAAGSVGQFGPRPVVHFDSTHSHMQLSPQKDLSGPWTVEFWLWREPTPAPTTGTAPLGDAALGGSGAGATADGPGGSQSKAKLASIFGVHVNDVGGPGPGQDAATVWGAWAAGADTAAGGDGGGAERSARYDRERIDEGVPWRGRGRSAWLISPPAPPATGDAAAMAAQFEADKQADAAADADDSFAGATTASAASGPSGPDAVRAAPRQMLHFLERWSARAALLGDGGEGTGLPIPPSAASVPPRRLPLTTDHSDMPALKPLAGSADAGTDTAAAAVRRPAVSSGDKENIPAAAAADRKPTLPPQYLLSSPSFSVQLQMGGRIFGPGDVPDPLAESEPVHEQALCMSISQRGGAEKALDFVVPTGQWVHIALSCSAAGGSSALSTYAASGSGGGGASNSSVVALYVNGELKDAVTMRFQLPLATVGSSRRGQSFYGHLAEMRVWSTERSAVEIKRDMFSDVEGAGARGLLAYLRCTEGHGRRTFDAAGWLHFAKLCHCRWARVPQAPAMLPLDVPSFMLQEPEEAEGLFGESTGSSSGVIELTGSLKRGNCRGATGELAADAAEVVCVCYRVKPLPADVDGSLAVPRAASTAPVTPITPFARD
jgi:hypothetical protein